MRGEAHVQLDELAPERTVEHDPQNLEQSFHRLSLNSHHSPTVELQVSFSTTEYTEHTESFLRGDSRVERVDRVEVLYILLTFDLQSYTAYLIQKILTLLHLS